MTAPLVVFGGTFDPPHLHHVTMAEGARTVLGADEVLFVPARLNPHRQAHPPVSGHHRLEMVRLAIAGHPRLRVDDLELERDGPSFTVDTLRELRRRGERRPIRLLIGSDQALRFHTWRDPGGILELATPAVVLRPPQTRESFADAIRTVEQGAAPAERWLEWLLPLPPIDCSSTEARACLARGCAPTGLIAPEVEAYIRQHGLYGTRS